MNGQNHQPAASLRLSCGRRFSYRCYGPIDGFPVIALHGTPGSHLKFEAAAEAAFANGLQLIALDRWSYGATDAPAMASLAGFADDVGEIADLLGIARFAVVGISGGGPYASAVAACLGHRVSAAALIAPVGPIAGVVPAPKLGSYHHMAFRVLPRMPGILPVAFGLLRQVALRAPKLATKAAAGRALAADRCIARDPMFALSLGRAFAAGLATDARGPLIDMDLFSRAWDFDVAATRAATRIWIGDQDRNVPLAAVDALNSRLKHAPGPTEITRLAGHGHFWIARNFTPVLGWIASNSRT